MELPSNSSYITGFYEQMTSSTRVTEVSPRTGQPEARWIDKRPDHYLHAANYNRLAGLKGAVGQALLESYKEETAFPRNSIASWANLVRLKGIKMN